MLLLPGWVSWKRMMNEASDMCSTTFYGKPLGIEAEKERTGSKMNHSETRFEGALSVCTLNRLH